MNITSHLSRLTILSLTLVSVAGCRDLTGALPAGTADPESVKNAKAAVAMAVSARSSFQTAFALAIMRGGLLTDELQANARGSMEPPANSPLNIRIDARLLGERSDVLLDQGLYTALHDARGMARQAIGALAKYAPDSSTARQAELYALIGYAEIMLADFFCSGVPLSTIDFEQDFTYRPSSTTAEVYQHAVALFDTASALSSDSLPILNLARVGKGRALLALGEYSAAATAVRDVPANFAHVEKIYTCDPLSFQCRVSNSTDGNRAASLNFGEGSGSGTERGVSVADGEAGRSYVLRTDPRTASNLIDTTVYGFAVYTPQKYTMNGASTVTLADFVEARLILAEAALHANDVPTWLLELNALRAADPRTANFPAIVDPGTAEARIDTLFAERARWLFLTAHRQGDLRRLIRQYEWTEERAYPSGTYPGGVISYDRYVEFPIPEQERLNPLFNGCLRRGA